MRHEKVDGMLKAYRFDVGRCGHLQTEIARLKKDIAHAMETLVQEAATVPSGEDFRYTARHNRWQSDPSERPSCSPPAGCRIP